LFSLLGVNKRANNLAARSELGRYPIGINMILATFSFLQHVKYPIVKGP
jgi:hypothetical protein